MKSLKLKIKELVFGSVLAQTLPEINDNPSGGGQGTELGRLKGLPGGFDPGTKPEEATGALTKILSNSLGVLTIVAGLMFIVYFILGGIQWISSSGERDKVEKAKHQMTNAAIGLIIVVASYTIAFIIGKVLGVEILNPAKYILENLTPGSD